MRGRVAEADGQLVGQRDELRVVLLRELGLQSSAQPSGAFDGLPGERDREPVERLLAAGGVLELRDELDAQLQVVGLAGGDEPPHDLRHDLVADERVVRRLLREPREFRSGERERQRRSSGSFGSSGLRSRSPAPSRRRARRVAG